MDNVEQWQVILNDYLVGPYTSEQVLQLYNAGQINENTHVIRCNTNQMTPFVNTELMQYVQQPYNQQDNQMQAQTTTLHTDNKIDNTLVILYSIFTSVASIFALLTLIGVTTNFDDLFLLGFFLLVVSAVLLIVDAVHMRKLEKKFDAWLISSFLLPPVYLFFRAEKTDKNKVYAVLSIINYCITNVKCGFYLLYVFFSIFFVLALI